MRWIVLLMITLLVALQYALWVGDGSLAEVWRLHKAIGSQRVENEQLTERNRALAAEVEDLKQGLAAIEERARVELGMIREGEVFHQVVENDK
jgi:cell division protein FtsB